MGCPSKPGKPETGLPRSRGRLATQVPVGMWPPALAGPRRLPTGPAPPSEAEGGEPMQRRLPGEYLIFTDASAMRPKDPYLRRAACLSGLATARRTRPPGPCQGPSKPRTVLSFSPSPWPSEFSKVIWKLSRTAKGWSMRRSVSGVVAKSTLPPGTRASGPDRGTPCLQEAFAEYA